MGYLARLSALMATMTLAAAGHSLPAIADGTDRLTVDFAHSTGAFRGGATGTLYGFGDEGAPTQALIDGAHITNTSQKAPYGTQHPSGDALKVEEGFFHKHGKDMYIYVQDYYPDWPYNAGKRPADDRTYRQADGTWAAGPNGVWDYLEVIEFVAEAVATGSSRPRDYVFIPFNEPDGGNWYPDWASQKDQFLADWTAAYRKIQEVYARHGLGHARIGGPGDTGWRPERSADILTYAKADGSLPDVFIWHELGIDNLRTFRAHTAEYRKLEKDLGIGPLQVNITEWGMLRDMGTPGQLVQWLSIMEDLKVDGQTAYWNYAGNLSDNSARANAANAGWWMFKWYGDLAGSRTVKVTPPALNTVDSLQAIAAVDTRNKRATVLYGGGGKPVALSLTGLDPRVFGRLADVEVREITLSGAEGVHGTPRVVKALSGIALGKGVLDIEVPAYDRYAAYQVLITPRQDRAVTIDPVWQSSIEAEKTGLTAATVYQQDPLSGGGWKFLASGGSDVGSFNSTASKADWTVTVPRTGTYRFQVIGGTPGTPGKHALFVDGADTATVQYTANLALTSYQKWQYRGSAEVTVPLTAGQHVLSLRAGRDGASVLPNSDITLDKFLLTEVSTGEPTTYPASTLRYSGGARVTYDTSGAHGYAEIRGEAARAEAYAQAWETGYYDVSLDYRSKRATAATITVNGRAAATVRASRGGSWRSTVRLHLVQGINEVEITSGEGLLLQQLTTTRAAGADSAAVTVQAENTSRQGTTAISTYGPASNASGGKGLGYIGNGTANTFVVARAAGFDKPGDYDVTVSYANADLRGAHAYNPQVIDRRLDVTETGGGSAHGYFRYTGAWDSFLEKTIPITLTSTSGPLVFGNPAAYAPDIDKITIAPAALGTPVTVRR